MQHPLYTAHASCSIEQCCRQWSATAHAMPDAINAVERALTEAGVVSVKLGIRDADGVELRSHFCRECYDALRERLPGAA